MTRAVLNSFLKKSFLLGIGIGWNINFLEAHLTLDPTSEEALQNEEDFIQDLEKQQKESPKQPQNIRTSQANVPQMSQPQQNFAEGIPVRKEEDSSKGRKSFAGFYGGLGGSINNVYAESELWSRSFSPIYRPPSIGGVDPNVYYGSYAYNNNTWLLSGQAFVGYDFPITRLFRFGLELQCAMSWREAEISSNGIYASKKQGVSPKEFTFGGQQTEEVDFGYTRPTLKFPFHVSFLPRMGITLLGGTLLYTKLGLRYESIGVWDHPETIDVGTQKNPAKKQEDKVFDSYKAFFVGGIGLETKTSRRGFIRLECLYAGNPKITLDRSDLKVENSDRQTENLQIKSIKNFSFSFGTGIRF
ncbi:hypothetical protein AGMMS49949_06230 [Alphaproteobacteria bacterium]|nr:hypothetical protein AGMMS49949_06230 [Alphaproteobacteria bacterium]GHS98195.1 hypothetical protein AGMMS50296_5730 [Alphaproteobacteria bacterium]